MVTIKLKYDVNDEGLSLIRKYLRLYSSILHVFYLLLTKESELGSEFSYIKSGSICLNKVNLLNNIELMNSWFILCAIKEAYLLLKNKHVIFGGKKNFIRRCKGLISREGFKENKKLNPIYSIGTAKPYKGNRFFRLTEDLLHIVFLPNKQVHINLKLHILNYSRVLSKLYIRLQLKDLPITYKLDDKFIYIMYEEDKLYNIKYQQVSNRVLGIDLNPNYIGWTIVDWKSSSEFEIIKSGVYSIKELNDKDFKLKKLKLSSESKERIYISNKRRFETLLIVKNLINKAIYYKCLLISIEDLNIKSSDKELGKRFNKLVNNSWNRNLFENNIQKRCNIFGIKLLKVKPEYSSFIGNFLFRSLNLPDMVLASIELSRRAYEFYNQYVIKITNIKKNIIQPNINDFKNFYQKSLEEFKIEDNHLDLKELYYLFKKSKIMYRLSIDSMNLLFSRFFAPKTYIQLANFG